MNSIWLTRISFSIGILFIFISSIFAQNSAVSPIKSREISEDDGVPVLTKHLPDYENARKGATYILNQNELLNALGSRGVLDVIDFEGGTEAVTTQYAAGKLLIVEFTTPQASIDADRKINERLAQNGQNQSIVYRRIGNYNAFVFDTNDAAAANILLDQIKYEKTVQWLGEDPFMLKRAERAMVKGLSELFVATTLAILVGIGFSIFMGIVAGFLYFRYREQKRIAIKEFSDAGGMTRLNLDGFTPQIATDKLLKE